MTDNALEVKFMNMTHDSDKFNRSNRGGGIGSAGV